MNARFIVPALLLIACSAKANEEATAFFKNQVLPIFEAKCLKCHSHQAGKMKGGLTLDSRSFNAIADLKRTKNHQQKTRRKITERTLHRQTDRQTSRTQNCHEGCRRNANLF